MTNFQIILSIIFIDAVCGALLLATVPNYLMIACSNHVFTGTLVSGMYSFKRISDSIFQQIFRQNFYGSNRISLLCSIFIYFITFLILMLTDSVALVMICRFTHALTNGTVVYCKSLIISMKLLSKSAVNRIIEAMICLGCIVGLILGAYIYDTTNQFHYVACAAAIFAFVNLSLVQNLSWDCRESNQQFLNEFIWNWVENFKIFPIKNNHKQYYKLILLKCFYAASIIMCLQKYAFILSLMYHCTRIWIGFVLALEQILKFITNFTLTKLNERFYCQSVTLKMFKFIYFLYMVVIMSPYLITDFNNFLIVFCIVAITRSAIDLCWNLCFNIPPNTTKFDLLQFYSDVIYIILPIFYGILWQLYGMATFQIVFLLPIVSIVFICYAEVEIVTKVCDD